MADQAKRVLVIGGGIAGAATALNLAEAGVAVDLVERGEFLGGRAAKITCKATDACAKCNGCLAEPRLRDVQGHPGITVHRRAEVTALDKDGEAYRATIRQRPALIDAGRCTVCGLCLEACPSEGAIVSPALAAEAVRLAIDPAKCLYFSDGRSTLCRDVCPEEAIDFAAQPEASELAVDAVVVATGFLPYDPTPKERLGYGRLPAVVTALELEEALRAGGPALTPDGREARKIAFIQCVGSRETAGNNYCSRVCCGYALRLGLAVKDRQGAEVSVFYMDIQSFGHAFDEFLAAAGGDLNLIRSMPYDVLEGPEGRVLAVYQAEPGRAPLEEEFDLVVLSVGMAPSPDNAGLAEMTGLGLDGHGFLAAGAQGGGVFLAGAASRPMDVAEVVASAGHAAGRALDYLERS